MTGFKPDEHPRSGSGEFVPAARATVSDAQRARLACQASALVEAPDPGGRLTAMAEELGLTEEDLGDLIFDIKGLEASEVNNRGLSAQAEFLGLDLGSRAWEESELDEQVHGTKSGEASGLANSTLATQVSFLVGTLGEEGAERELRTLGE